MKYNSNNPVKFHHFPTLEEIEEREEKKFNRILLLNLSKIKKDLGRNAIFIYLDRHKRLYYN